MKIFRPQESPLRYDSKYNRRYTLPSNSPNHLLKNSHMIDPLQRHRHYALASARNFNLLESLESRAMLSAAPTITTQPPGNLFGTQGASATLTATAAGSPAPTVQWEVSQDGISAFTPITNNASATTDTLVIPNLTLNDEFNQYEAVFTNSAGTIATSATTLYVNLPTSDGPSITQQPNDEHLAEAGDTATFQAAATATIYPTVQWYVEAAGATSFTPITDNPSATTDTLTLPNVPASMNGSQYEAIFTNAAGTATTSAATLSVPASTSSPTPAAPPSAALAASVLRRATGIYKFSVTYTSSAPIDTSTLNIHDLVVTGPDGFQEEAILSAFTPANNGKSVSVTYLLKSPTKGWTAAGNGKYHIYVRASRVKDTSGNAVPSGVLGAFKVLVA